MNRDSEPAGGDIFNREPFEQVVFKKSNFHSRRYLHLKISCYILIMTIEQTIEVPASRRIFLDLPPELPIGKAKVTVTPQMEKSSDNAYGTTTKLRGLAKKMGSTLTVESFLEMRQEDLRLEEEKIETFPHKKGN